MIIGITIGIILIGSVLAVVADPEQYKNYTYNTDGNSATIANAQDETEVTISWDKTSTNLMINDINYAYTVNDIVFFSDTSLMRITTVPTKYCEWVHEGKLVTGIETITLTINNGEVAAEWTTTSGTTGTATAPYSWICYRDNAGMDRIGNTITSSKTVYYSDENPIYAVMPAKSNYVVSWVNDEGSYQGSEIPATLNGTEYRDAAYSALLSYTATSQLSGTISDGAVYPWYYAVSGSVDTSSADENQYWDLIGIIPLFAILAIVIMAVKMVTDRRD